MTAWIAVLVAWITAHPQLAYLAVFALALSESIPVIGVVVPGTAVIVAIAALVPGGAVKLWPLMAVAFAGAVAGDGLPYLVGRRHARALLSRWPLVRCPGLVARSEAFMARHGDKGVFLARFTPGVRAFVPLFAGILQMPARRFYTANILSAAVWTPTHILPGVLLGASFGHLGRAALPAAALLVILVALGWGTVVGVPLVARLASRRLAPAARAARDRLASAAQTRGPAARRLATLLLDPAVAERRSLLALGALLVAAAWLFLGTLEDLVSGDPLVALDASFYRHLQALRTPPGDAVMIAITELGDATVVVAVALAVLAWLLVRRARCTAAYWTVGLAGAALLNTAIKGALHRPRPGPELYAGWSAFSFPSGHSTINAVLYGLLALIVARRLRPRAALSVVGGAAVLVVGIAFSRLYLGAHWLSDVAGGLAFGLAWVALLGLYWLRGPREDVAAPGLLGVAVLVLAVVGTVHVTGRHAADVEAYAVAPSPRPTLTAAAWREAGWQVLPARRTDLTGELEEPISLQWAGRRDALRRILEDGGWTVAPRWSAASASGWLSAKTPAARLPVVPDFDGGASPGLTMIDAGPDAEIDTRALLRVWRADVDVLAGPAASIREPLWYGSIVVQRLYRPASLFSVAWTPAHGDIGSAGLDGLLPNASRARDGPGTAVGGRVASGGGPLLASRLP